MRKINRLKTPVAKLGVFGLGLYSIDRLTAYAVKI